MYLNVYSDAYAYAYLSAGAGANDVAVGDDDTGAGVEDSEIFPPDSASTSATKKQQKTVSHSHYPKPQDSPRPNPPSKQQSPLHEELAQNLNPSSKTVSATVHGNPYVQSAVNQTEKKKAAQVTAGMVV